MPAPLVAISGNIGSGKSTASRYLKSKGAECIDADQLARNVVTPDQPAYVDIVSVFGPKILAGDKSIDRDKLGSIIFSDSEKKKQLEAITHPRIREAMMIAIMAAQAKDVPLIVLEIPLLFESRLYEQFPRSLLVFCNDELRKQRICARDRLSVDEALLRMQSQMPQAEKIDKAMWVVENNTSQEHLEQQLDDLWPALLD